MKTKCFEETANSTCNIHAGLSTIFPLSCFLVVLARIIAPRDDGSVKNSFDVELLSLSNSKHLFDVIKWVIFLWKNSLKPAPHSVRKLIIFLKLLCDKPGKCTNTNAPRNWLNSKLGVSLITESANWYKNKRFAVVSTENYSVSLLFFPSLDKEIIQH